MLSELADAIESLVLSGDASELCDAFARRDRLNAKLTAATGECLTAELHTHQRYSSLTAMLWHRAGLSLADSRRQVGLARKLRSAKLTADAWLDGALREGQVMALAPISSGRYRERCHENEAAIIDTVATVGTPQTLGLVRRWKADVDARDEPRPREPDANELFVSPVLDSFELKGTFDADVGSLIAKAVKQATVKRRELTPAQRRGEALASICSFYLAFHGTHEPRVIARKQRPHLNLSQTVERLEGHLPGVVRETGLPVPAHVVERTLCDCNLHRYLRSGDSALLDYGRKVRTAPANLAQAVLERDGGCRGDECTRGPEDCDIHHLTPWEHGGETRADNLGSFCGWDHAKIHREGITVELDPDGTMTFRHPDGRTWQTKPRSQQPRLPYDKPPPPPRPMPGPVIYDAEDSS